MHKIWNFILISMFTRAFTAPFGNTYFIIWWIDFWVSNYLRRFRMEYTREYCSEWKQKYVVFSILLISGHDCTMWRGSILIPLTPSIGEHTCVSDDYLVQPMTCRLRNLSNAIVFERKCFTSSSQNIQLIFNKTSRDNILHRCEIWNLSKM